MKIGQMLNNGVVTRSSALIAVLEVKNVVNVEKFHRIFNALFRLYASESFRDSDIILQKMLTTLITTP